jgi:hypothetical protein
MTTNQGNDMVSFNDEASVGDATTEGVIYDDQSRQRHGLVQRRGTGGRWRSHRPTGLGGALHPYRMDLHNMVNLYEKTMCAKAPQALETGLVEPFPNPLVWMGGAPQLIHGTAFYLGCDTC